MVCDFSWFTRPSGAGSFPVGWALPLGQRRAFSAISIEGGVTLLGSSLPSSGKHQSLLFSPVLRSSDLPHLHSWSQSTAINKRDLEWQVVLHVWSLCFSVLPFPLLSCLMALWDGNCLAWAVWLPWRAAVPEVWWMVAFGSTVECWNLDRISSSCPCCHLDVLCVQHQWPTSSTSAALSLCPTPVTNVQYHCCPACVQHQWQASQKQSGNLSVMFGPRHKGEKVRREKYLGEDNC